MMEFGPIVDLTHKEIDNFKEYEKTATVKAVQIPYQFKVKTLEGTMTGNPNDWLAEGIHKERYPIKNEIFKKTYQETITQTISKTDPVFVPPEIIRHEHQAESIARQAHRYQLRRGGMPYVIHLSRVANRCDTDKEKAIAWLHDILEDTRVNINYLKRVFPIEIVETISLLTHIEGETYEQYIRKIAKNPLATKIKLFDIEDNLADSPTEHQVKKYKKALDILKGPR